MFGKRSDGSLVKGGDPILRITSAIMKHRYDAMVNYLLEVDCANLDEFILKEREKGYNFNYMDIAMAAIVRMYAERPELNRFTMNTRIYDRKGIYICLTVKKSLREGADETTIKLAFDGTENIYEIKEQIDKQIRANKGTDKENSTDRTAKFLMSLPPFVLKGAVGLIKFMDRHGLVPKSLINLSPFHASCFLTNMKSISTEYVFHHLYDFGTVGMFVGMGKEIIKPIADPDGKGYHNAKILQFGITIDERICDGLYYARSIKRIKSHLINIDSLRQNYEIPFKPKKKHPLKNFIDIEKGTHYVNQVKHSATSIYDTMNDESYNYVLNNLDKVKTDVLELTFDKNNKAILERATSEGFKPNYNWFSYKVKETDAQLEISPDICQIKNRSKVKKQLTEQAHELALREPSLFDKNGEQKGWHKAGKNCTVIKVDGKIASILTWQIEPQHHSYKPDAIENIHIYLAYTLPEYRNRGLCSKLIDYVKKYAAQNNIKSITACTDTTPENRVPHMLEKNGFTYYKTGFVKVLKEK